MAWLYTSSLLRSLVTANVVPSSPILVTLMMEELRSSETSEKSEKTAFFIVTALITSNLTKIMQSATEMGTCSRDIRFVL
jgi:hypothetical protein